MKHGCPLSMHTNEMQAQYLHGIGIHVIVIKGITIAITKPKRSYITFKALVYQLHECALKLFYSPNYV